MNLGPRLTDDYTGTLRHALTLTDPALEALEFGVGQGGTLALIAARMHATGFDSFTGLPEDWRPGFPAGTFACDPPDIPNTDLIIGLYEDTLPTWQPPGPIGLVHIDCDLYTSTATVLAHIGTLLNPGCLVIFDEWHGYEGAEHHEQRAWLEWAQTTGAAWEPIGHGPEQFALRLR